MKKKTYCPELKKMFYSYTECNHSIAEYLGIKNFNVGKVIKLQNGYYKKHNLHFYEATVGDFYLPF